MKSSFTVGELAKMYGVGTDSIRYYEEQGLIAPKRAPNGYRVYSIRNIWRMNVIRDLRALGFSLERIRTYLEDRSVESTLALLEEERREVARRMEALAALRANVDDRLATLRRAQQSPPGVVEEVHFPTRHCHQIEEAFRTDEEVDVLIKRLMNHDRQRLYLIGSSNIGCRIPLAAVQAGHLAAYSAAFLIDEAGSVEIEGGHYLRLLYHGSTQKQNKTCIPQLLAYAQANGLRPAGDVLELLWVDIHEAADEREHLTELQWRVEPL